MAVYRREVEATSEQNRPSKPAGLAARSLERRLMLLISTVLLVGVALTVLAKLQRLDETPLVDLSRLTSAEELAPALDVFELPADRQFAAEQLVAFIEQTGSPANVGALARARV
ncbi:MAG: hypothetical protein AAGI08_06685, partial [Bacteroidota bacterium]